MRTQYSRPMGDVSRRLHGVALQLYGRMESATTAANDAEALGQTEFAASLRGKARGYQEAINLLSRLDQGLPIRRKHRWLGRTPS